MLEREYKSIDVVENSIKSEEDKEVISQTQPQATVIETNYPLKDL